MNKKIVTALLALVCVVAGAASVIVYTGEDKRGPEITLTEKEIFYQDGDDMSVLLDGVTAKDNVDGDVTASLMVEAIYPSIDETTAKVVYAAMDSSNNVTKAQRMVNYGMEEPEEETEPVTEEETEAVEENPLADVTLVVANATNTPGIAAAWQERLAADGYGTVAVGSYGEVLQVSAICSEHEELIEVLKEYFPNALVEEDLPFGRVDVSLNNVDVCVIVGENDIEVPEMPVQ